jgi:very-short-patch-repair endonuclease
MLFLPGNQKLHPVASRLRATLTEAELLLWSRVRRKQILGIQFYRQKVIGSYIVDFYASAIRLVIELDGSQHYEPEAMEKDKVRDAYLNELGLHVLRFGNNEVRLHLESVLEAIHCYASNFIR